jgi:hypothetical protein
MSRVYGHRTWHLRKTKEKIQNFGRKICGKKTHLEDLCAFGKVVLKMELNETVQLIMK